MRRHLQRAKAKGNEVGALQLLNEAVYLLRCTPLTAFVIYYLGSIPFILALLFFWADMSRSPYAAAHCGPGALLLAFLFIVMKCCHSRFAKALLACRQDATPEPICWRQFPAIVGQQALLHASGLILLPLAALAALPLAWTFAFYQNVTVLGWRQNNGLRHTAAGAWQHAARWPGQNHLLLIGLYFVALVLFVNVFAIMQQLPMLAKSLLGLDSTMTLSPWTMFNTTFIAIIAGLTYLLVDPLLKAAYTLRCFYSAALDTGADLLSELRHIEETRLAARALLIAVVAGLFALGPLSIPTAAAEEVAAAPSRPATEPGAPAEQPSPGISPNRLNAAIEQVIQNPEYAWRLPREEVANNEEAPGLIFRILNMVAKTTERIFRTIRDWLDKIWTWLEKHFRQPSRTPGTEPWKLGDIRIWVWLTLAALAISVLALLLLRRRRRPAPAGDAEIEVITATPDIRDESVTADQLPEDEWRAIATEMFERGEKRLGIRALFLALLANLARRDLIRIARAKSDRDYLAETGRRSHALPELVAAFAQNINTFEKIWYGTHNIDDQTLAEFTNNMNAITS